MVVNKERDTIVAKPIVVGICGSPRKQATEYILKVALKMLNEQGCETYFYTVRGKSIGYCVHCDYCVKTKKGCAIKDDMYEVYSLFKKADGLILASPVYYGGVSAQLKAVMDRCRALVAEDYYFFNKKVGTAIAVGGDRIGGQEPAIEQIITFYIINGALPVSGGSFGANLGATFWSKDTLEGVKEDSEGLKSLEKTVKQFVQVVNRS